MLFTKKYVVKRTAYTYVIGESDVFMDVYETPLFLRFKESRRTKMYEFLKQITNHLAPMQVISFCHPSVCVLKSLIAWIVRVLSVAARSELRRLVAQEKCDTNVMRFRNNSFKYFVT